MFTLEFDGRAFEAYAKQIEEAERQLPYALARSMNDALGLAREEIIEKTWPQHVKQRNAAFIKRAMRRRFANKYDLVVALYDDLGKGNLQLHAHGGTIRPLRSSRLSIPPPGTVTRTGRGVRKSQTPKAIIASTPKRALRITPKGILVGQGGRLHLKYAFKGSASQRADVPFFEDFSRVMRTELYRAFPAELARALKPRPTR